VTRTVEHRPARGGRPPVEVVRSSRRRRSATAFVRDGRIVVQLPADLDVDAQEQLIERLVDKVSGAARVREVGGDDALARRADELADRYLDGIRATSVTWSARMGRRWGSCTPSQGTIRVSQALAAFPSWVLDYVLVHELAHLQQPGHGPGFHDLVARYPQADRARGFLDGVQWADARHDPAASPSSGSSSPSSDSASSETSWSRAS
jgi:predicted metal-dependent hydrolase